MEFGLNDEQSLVVKTVRNFVENEIYPLEEKVEKTGIVEKDIGEEIKRKVIELGFFAPNLPVEVGGGGLDNLTFALLERELGRGSQGLTIFWGRPSNILMACEGSQKEKYLIPAVKGEKYDALAMTEPQAGSDVRGMKCFARKDGEDFIVNGTKHFISHANIADFIIVFIATGEEETTKGKKKLITCFLVDRGIPGFEIKKGYKSVSHRGYQNCILNFDECRLSKENILGELHKGFEVANDWLYATRITVICYLKHKVT
jgi:acyl-CoA dehydrogenase